MKRIVVLIIAIICCLSSVELKAQKTKEFAGTVKFVVKSQSEEESQKPVNDSNVVTYIISGNNTKTTIPHQGYTENRLSFGDSTQEWTILDTPTEIIVVKKTKEDFDEEKETIKLTVTPLDETKVIGDDLFVTNIKRLKMGKKQLLFVLLPKKLG